MGLITPTQLYKLLDKVVATYQQVLGTGSNGMGDGTFGASYKALDIKNLVNASADVTFADSDLQAILTSASSQLTTKLLTATVVGSQFADFLSALSSLCSVARSTVSATILDLDTYMSWYNYTNAVTYWQCMAPPDFRGIYYAVRSAYPTAKNVYFPVVQGTTVLGQVLTNALRKLIIGTGQTAGYTVDYSQYGGGRPYIVWTGGNGSGAVTITVTGVNQDGTADIYTASGTWGVGSYVATNTGIALTPTGGANNLIVSASDITISGMSAGTCYVEARTPASRTYPPT